MLFSLRARLFRIIVANVRANLQHPPRLSCPLGEARSYINDHEGMMVTTSQLALFSRTATVALAKGMRYAEAIVTKHEEKELAAATIEDATPHSY